MKSLTHTLDIAFCREYLRLVHLDVRQAFPQTDLKKAWVYHLGRDHWEFHYQDFYWHGSAGNAYDARAKGWGAWLNQH